jgi:glutamate 5-kinase
VFCRVRYLFSFDAVEISVAAHDTTGGMETKILEAAVIARLGIDVYITKVRMLLRFCHLETWK